MTLASLAATTSSAAAAAAFSCSDTAAVPGFAFVGHGFCKSASGQRPQNFYCATHACPAYTPTSCAAICANTGGCTGFMIQDMSLYGLPNTCVIVSPAMPAGVQAADWAEEYKGEGLAIADHDSEPRDCCYKKSGPPAPPGPPSPNPPPPPPPPPAPAPAPPAPGACPDGTLCDTGDTCCKLPHPWGWGCVAGPDAVCCTTPGASGARHGCVKGTFCNFTAPEPGDWSCDKRADLTAPLPPGSAFGVAPHRLVGEELERSQDLDCYGKQHAWTTWPSEAPPERCPAGSKGDRTCTPFERSKDLLGLMFNGCAISHNFKHANRGADFPALDMTDGGTGSDTWYPYWGADGRWYSTFTDGTVGSVHSQSGGQNPSMHGQVVVEPAGGLGTGNAGDPKDLTIVQAAVFAVNGTPFAGE
jgi:hypothetical protein|eukprot:COSAG06_NODE_50_length_28525_cov_88.227010_29_plen_415_part_00